MTVLTHAGATHDVENQPPPLVPFNLFTSDTVLQEGVAREGAGWAGDRLAAAGATWGSEQLLDWATRANENPPKLRTHDRFGHRIDEVDFHPAWHELMRTSSESGLNMLPWTGEEPARHVARAAAGLMGGQVEAGHGCPMTMTFAAIPALRAEPELAAEWEPLLCAAAYDPRLIPAREKGSAKAGMGMTEKQGGSDVRSNTTRAVPDGDVWRLTGHKWFCSAPMCDVFLILAQTENDPAHPSCFLVPRILPDGARNTFRLQRLKDKLGDRSNASSEVEFDDTVGWLVGDLGRGVRTIIEMVGHTRLDCMIGSAAGMRAAVAAATWHAAHRAAFGKPLVDQPLMRNVLADLAIESEAATAMALRVARAYDEDDRVLKRLGTAIGKFHVCKRLPNLAFEAMECLGGNGYVEESGMPRLFRQSPLNSIWEGSGNVNALDVLRALAKEPDLLQGFFDEVELAGGTDTRLDAFVATVRSDFSHPHDLEHRARLVVERLALALQASLLIRNAPPAVADAFCATRLNGDGGLNYGTLPAGVDVAAIIERHTPAIR